MCKPRLSSTETCEISRYFRQFLFWVRIPLKRFTQVLPYAVCTQVRRHVHKRINKRRYGEENPGRFVFGKPVLFTLGLGLTTPYSLGVLVWNFYQTIVTVSTEFWLTFEDQIRPRRLTINFLLITARAERKVCFVRNCLIFFVGEYSSVWPKTYAFFPQIQWRFLRGISGKNYFGRIFRKFCANQRRTETCEISPYFRQFLFWVRIALKRFTQVLPYAVCTQVRRHVHKRITKRRYGEENPGRFVFGKPVLFPLGQGLTTPYSLDVLVWNFYQTFVTVSIEFWLTFEAQIRPTRLAINFLLITARAERKVCFVRNCLIFFVGEYSSVWPEIYRVLSQIQWRFLRGIWGKNYFGRIFRKFCANQRLSSTETCEISPYFRQFLFWVHIALKRFTQVRPYAVCTQVRRHVHKRITKRRDGEENPGRVVFGKPVLFTLGLGLTTSYSLGVLVWNFSQTFVTVSIEVWLRFEVQIRPTRLGINYLLITARAERKVRLCAKQFDFFRGRILICLTWNLSRFFPNSVEILTWYFRKKIISGEFFRNFVQTKVILYRNLWNFALLSTIFILGPYCAEKVHTSTSVCCLHPGKEGRR